MSPATPESAGARDGEGAALHPVFSTAVRAPVALDVPVFVGPHNRLAATHAPGTITPGCRERGCPGPHTSDWRHAPGSAENFHRVGPVLVRATLRDVFETHYPNEAHVVGYALTRDGAVADAQPRIAKDALPWLREQGYEVVLTCLLADWDTPAHVPWTPELRAHFDALWSAGEGPFATAGVYLSPRGVRLVQPLETPLVVEDGEARLRAWFDELIAHGADASTRDAKDWTRFMRCANYSRRVA